MVTVIRVIRVTHSIAFTSLFSWYLQGLFIMVTVIRVIRVIRDAVYQPMLLVFPLRFIRVTA